MTLVDTATGEILDRERAEHRAADICMNLDSAAENFEYAMDQMRAAIRDRDDIALGYRSPGDYISDHFGGRLARLGVDLRREVVREMTEMGMSTRAIAPIVGISKSQVANDQVSTTGHLPQTPEPVRGGEAASGSGQTACERPPVVGIDGKTYTRPAAPTPPPVPVKVPESPRQAEWDAKDRAEELAENLAKHVSLLYAVTDPERRAEFIANWRLGNRDNPILGAEFVTPKHLRELSAALRTFASEWETANV